MKTKKQIRKHCECGHYAMGESEYCWRCAKTKEYGYQVEILKSEKKALEEKLKLQEHPVLVKLHAQQFTCNISYLKSLKALNLSFDFEPAQR